jgi:hypothetical protein
MPQLDATRELLKLQRQMIPVTDLNDAKARINAHSGLPEEFQLPVSSTLLDPVGINMAIITDCILIRGWKPDGFVPHDGYRVYRYKAGNGD